MDANSKKPTLVFIYDREVTVQDSGDERIALCRKYADGAGWQVAGQWVDRGDAAVASSRPGWMGMVGAMSLEGQGCRIVCLVSTLDRVAFDPESSIRLRQLVSGAGGVVLAVDDECDAGQRQLLPTLRSSQDEAVEAPQKPETPARVLRWRGQTIAPGVTLMLHGGIA
ncbi:hypothetical protein ABZ370_19605 [Streptomyces sp. NPDC005962]|uniref:hypothetical protein n=1 Tax=Streptomyces sp. NPDC005962 TaxID=3154466 RepID=UPI0033C90737